MDAPQVHVCSAGEITGRQSARYVLDEVYGVVGDTISYPFSHFRNWSRRVDWEGSEGSAQDPGLRRL
jgi:hypothetical protein